jgi:hypothetical protein
MGGHGMRGGYGGMPANGMPQMAYGHPQQGYPMAAHPQMYAAPQQYGAEGYAPQQQPAMGYGAMPQQGKSALWPSSSPVPDSNSETETTNG